MHRITGHLFSTESEKINISYQLNNENVAYLLLSVSGFQQTGKSKKKMIQYMAK